MIVLHIGTDKTGSTAIQKLISINRQVFEKKGWLYPKKIGENGHRQWKLYDKLKKNEFDILEELKKEVEESGLSNVLLSYEEYYKLEEEQIAKLLALLNSLNKGEVKIIIYLRRQDDKKESSLLQGIKHGILRGREEYGFQIEPELDYHTIMAKWEKFIDKKNIIIRPYGKSFFPHKDSLYEDFFQFVFGIDFNKIKESLTVPSKDPNPSLDAVSGYIAEFFAQLIADDYKYSFTSQLFALQNQYGKSKTYFLDKFERNRILSLYKRGNDTLIEKYSLPIALFQPEKKNYKKPGNIEIAERIALLYQRGEYLLPLYDWGSGGALTPNIKAHNINLIHGFYGVEEWGVWTKGNETAKLAFLVFRDYYNGGKYLDLIIKSRYLLNSNTISYMRAGDGDWSKLGGEDQYRLSTNNIRKNGGVVFVEFKHKNVISPMEIDKINQDNRVMGVGLESLTFVADLSS